MRWLALSMGCGIGIVALASSTASKAGPAPRAPVLAGTVVYRPECFGYGEADRPTPSSASTGSTRGSAKSGPRPSPPAKAPSAAAPPPPPVVATPMDLSSLPAGRYQSTAGAGGEAAQSDSAADNEPRNQLVAKPKEAEHADKDEEDTKKADDGLAAFGDRGGEEAPALDWGATVWLSNDDSMSLASAQRVIWNAQQGLRSPTSEIRPHELLNYFSFDTRAPTGDDTFGMLAAARQTGDRLQLAIAVKGATPEAQPLDLTLVIDRSGSMTEEGRMDYTRRGLRVMEQSLNRGDRVDLVLFDDQVCTPLENYVVGRDDPALLSKVIDQLAPRGATNIGIGLEEGYAVARRHADTRGRNRRMMVITDALLNQGNLDEASLTEVARAYDDEGIRVTGVGVGRGFNDKVLDQLTEKGKGSYVYLGSEAVVDRVFGTGFPSLVQTIAHDVHFAIDLPPSLGLERFYGEEASTEKEDVQPIHYYAGTTQLFLQDLRIRDGRTVGSDPVEFQAEWTDARTGEPMKKSWRTTVSALVDSDPRNVDKGLALMAWTDVLMADALGADPCGEPVATYGGRAGRLLDDAEIAFVNGLVQKRCPGFTPRSTLVSSAGRVPYKVKVDADIPIAEVALACAGQRWTDAISPSDTVARFDAMPGACTVTLTGAVEMAADVEVPSTGGDARCVVRGGRVSCG
jgi:Ca-activated chloride channel family protein